MAEPTYIFAGGGTGGHLFPGLAVAEALVKLRPAAGIVFACSDRQIDGRILAEGPYAVVPQPIRPLPRRVGGWGRFMVGWLRAAGLARDLLRDLRPAAVLALGGFAAVPVAREAARARTPMALLSIDALPGIANRALARRAEVIFAQFEPTVAAYGRHGGKVRVIGCPVRGGLLGADAGEARRHFALRDDRKTLLVMAGSLGAESINLALAGIRPELDALAGTWQVLHLAGAGKLADLETAWRHAAVHRAALEFCDRMDLAYAGADLVLCRAGASTVGELSATATPAVLMPYPHHRDRHQERNAAALVSAGAAAAAEDVSDPSGNAAALREALLPIMRDPVRLEAMRRAAGGRSRLEAAGEIARWLAG